MNQDPFAIHRIYNIGEAAVWFLIATLLVIFYHRRLPQPWRWLLPLSFALFGVSDVIELDTGAWWRPWWLGVGKAACVLVFLLALLAHRRHVRTHGHGPSRSTVPSAPKPNAAADSHPDTTGRPPAGPA